MNAVGVRSVGLPVPLVLHAPALDHLDYLVRQRTEGRGECSVGRDLFVGRLSLRVRHAPRHDADKGSGTRPLLPVARQSGHLGSALLDT